VIERYSPRQCIILLACRGGKLDRDTIGRMEGAASTGFPAAPLSGRAKCGADGDPITSSGGPERALTSMAG